MIWMLVAATTAWAGDGPWTLDPNVYNLYVGADYFRYDKLNDGKGETALDLGTGVTSVAVNGVWTVGLRPSIEGEVKVAYESVRINQPDAGPCAQPPEDIPSDWCDSTAGIGDIYGTLKWRILDEFAGAPFTIAVSGLIRSGEAYAPKRYRLTTLGDGQTDVGTSLSLGRKADLGLQRIRTFISGGYYYRFPNQFSGGRKVPTDEVFGQVSLAWSPDPSWEIGPMAFAFSRTGGIDIPDLDFNESDAWNQTDARQVKVGGQLSLFSIQQRTLSATVLYAVYAKNNPANTLSISVGGGQLRRVRPEDAP